MSHHAVVEYVGLDRSPEDIQDSRHRRILFVLQVDDLDGWLGREATEDEIMRAENAIEAYFGEYQWDAFQEEFGGPAEDAE